MRRIIFFVLAVSVSSTPVKRCPEGFDFSASGSCFKYVETELLQHSGAKEHCSSNYNGRLAVIDSRVKRNAVVEFFRTKFQEEQETEEGVPTAWIQGKWEPGTTYITYDNGDINHHPKWIIPAPNNESGRSFKFPTANLYGFKAHCVVFSLWGLQNGHQPERAGFYNVPCKLIYFTHPLCEVPV